MNNSKSQSKKCASEELQLKSNATQTVCEQPGYSQAKNAGGQTLSEQPGYFLHNEYSFQTVSEQPAYSSNAAATTVQTESEVPGYSSLATQSEQFYQDIADEYATRTPSVTEEQPIESEQFYHEISDEGSTRTFSITEGRQLQLPHLAFTYRFSREKACLVVSLAIATVIILTVPVTLIYVFRHKQPLAKTGLPTTPAAATADTLSRDYLPYQSTANTFKPHENRMSPTETQVAKLAPRSSSSDSSNKLRIFIPELIVRILSVGSDGQLLVGGNDEQLYICSENGELVNSLTVPFNDKVVDAVWSPREHHIVYTTHNIHKAMVMSVSGDIVHQTQMRLPTCLSVSPDNDIYVTDMSDGIHHSTDNGTTWHRLVNNRNKKWIFEQAIKVAPFNVSNCTVWILENTFTDWRLIIYTPDKRTWTDVVLPEKQVNLYNSRMTFDDHTSIYVTDWYNKAVHVWSVDGQYIRQLLSSRDIEYIPYSVALNKQRTKLYVAESNCFIQEFVL